MDEEEKICVTASALRTILQSLVGPEYLIRELQAIRNIEDLTGKKNPINILVEEYNAWVEKKRGESSGS